MSELIATDDRYQIAPLFQIRMAGVPFNALDGISSPRSATIARDLAARTVALETTATAALFSLRENGHTLGPRQLERLRRAIGMRHELKKVPSRAPRDVHNYAAEAADLHSLRETYERVLSEELDGAAKALHRAALRYLPSYSVFSSQSVEALAFDGLLDCNGTIHWHRQRDRHLLLYLQRLATKNETFSAFGPSAWGRVESCCRGATLEATGGLRRHAYLERWVANAVLGAMNRDPAVRLEVSPRLHPNGRLADGRFARLDTGSSFSIGDADRVLLNKCDGRRPAHEIGAEARLQELADLGVLLWELEFPALVVDRISALRREVRRWRANGAREKWEPILSHLADLPNAFAQDPSPSARRALMERVHQILAASGASGAVSSRRELYRATNPIAEECVRDCDFRLGTDAADALAQKAAPWFHLWRDTFNFVAHRVNEKLRSLHLAAARDRSAVPLPALLAAAEKAGLSLSGNGIPALAYLAFQEVKAAFREEFATRPDSSAWELSPTDCSFLRRRFRFPHLVDFTAPSADLQIAARSFEDVSMGRYRWVVSELHLAGNVLQHGIYWACPDPSAFGLALRTQAGAPLCDWGFLGADLATHTLIRYEALSDLWTYVGTGRVRSTWRTARPADAEVFVAADGDVRIRVGEVDCGSFARSWVLPLGFHPFVLSRAPHTPRLSVGGVVVQRELWILSQKDLPRAPYRHASPDLPIDVEKLRASKGIPRYVYIRPSEAAMRRLGAGGRDKDVKPVFIDLESYPFLDIFSRWLLKHGEIEVSEMLPDPDELPWREHDGSRTFELRTLVSPRPRAESSKLDDSIRPTEAS